MKRTLSIAVMVCALPALATAGTATLKTWAQTPGGHIETSLNAGFKQTSAYGAKYYTYSIPVTVGAGPTVTVVPQPGYTPHFTPGGTCGSTTLNSYTCGNGNGEVVGYFEYAPTMASVTATCCTGGTVNVASLKNIYIGQTLLSSVKFVFTPQAGGTVNTITLTVGGVPVTIPNSKVLVTGGTPTNPAKTVTFLAGYAVTGNIALAATFSAPAGGESPVACAPKTIILGDPAPTLTATPASGTWSRQGGPSVYDAVQRKNIPVGAITTDGVTSDLAVAGIYYFKYSVNGTYATTSVTVDNTLADATAASCTGCHDANGVGAGISASFPASVHASAGKVCTSCHVGANTGGHPGTVTATTVSPTTFTLTGPANGYPVGSNFCAQCHSNADQIVSLYNASPHPQRTGGPATCAGCHVDPHAVVSTTGPCIGCHVDSYGNVSGHPVDIGESSCISCHNAHSTVASMTSGAPHFNNITTGMYPASYMTPRSSCRDCHSTADNNAAIRNDWASSGHGDTRGLPWINYDFKILDDCVRCHTTTGYVNYVSSDFINISAWGDPSDKTKEVLACNGCHNPDYSRRSFNLVGPTGPSFTYTFPVSGTTVTTSYQFLSPISPNGIVNTDSNICMLCHRGTIDGEIIKKATAFADFTSVGRLLPHGMAAAGMLGDLLGAGYNYDEDYHVFSGKSDLSRHWSYHEYIGSANYHGTGANGACVTCHMSGTQHTFAAVFKNSTGSITGVTTQAVCNNCHPSVTVAGPMDATILKARKAGFAAALLVLKAQLLKSGFDPDSSDPKNWGETAHVRANNMGAYYNYFLFLDGDRAAYVHGPAYTRRLILSSLTWLDDNAFNVSAYATINTLASEGRITAATRDSAISFLGITSTAGIVTGICANCHPGHSGSIWQY